MARRLTRQQRLRIQQAQEKRRQKALQRIAKQVDSLSNSGLGREQSGLVIANHGPALIVENQEGSLYRCAVRQHLGTLVCGDRVIWQQSSSGEGVVIAMEERYSLLTRPDYSGRVKPVAANLDLIAVVVSPRPQLNEFLIDRYLVAIAAMRVAALLVVNKVDLLESEALTVMKERLATYVRIGYKTLFMSTRSGHGLSAIRGQLKDHTSLLVGQSGVGKSSLIKALLPDRSIRIRALSKATGHGTHTTTSSTLYPLPDGGHLIDTPGVRSFELGDLSPDDLELGFPEFAPYLGHCQFSNCSHTVEPACALREAVVQGDIDERRLVSYQQIKNSVLEPF